MQKPTRSSGVACIGPICGSMDKNRRPLLFSGEGQAYRTCFDWKRRCRTSHSAAGFQANYVRDKFIYVAGPLCQKQEIRSEQAGIISLKKRSRSAPIQMFISFLWSIIGMDLNMSIILPTKTRCFSPAAAACACQVRKFDQTDLTAFLDLFAPHTSFPQRCDNDSARGCRILHGLSYIRSTGCPCGRLPVFRRRGRILSIQFLCLVPFLGDFTKRYRFRIKTI